jgi:hypothetical protein
MFYIWQRFRVCLCGVCRATNSGSATRNAPVRLVMQTDGNLNSKFPGLLLDDFDIESD